MFRFLKHTIILLALVWAFIVFGGGSWIDSICVEGRLSQAQVEALNSLEWEKCPNYRQRAGGECRAEVDDRVVIRECSSLSRTFFLRDSERVKDIRKWFLRNFGSTFE